MPLSSGAARVAAPDFPCQPLRFSGSSHRTVPFRSAADEIAPLRAPHDRMDENDHLRPLTWTRLTSIAAASHADAPAHKPSQNVAQPLLIQTQCRKAANESVRKTGEPERPNRDRALQSVRRMASPVCVRYGTADAADRAVATHHRELPVSYPNDCIKRDPRQRHAAVGSRLERGLCCCCSSNCVRHRGECFHRKAARDAWHCIAENALAMYQTIRCGLVQPSLPPMRDKQRRLALS